MLSTFANHRFASLLCTLLIVTQSICTSNALRQTSRLSSVQSDLIDEIDAKKLEKLVQEKESVALYLCTCPITSIPNDDCDADVHPDDDDDGIH